MRCSIRYMESLGQGTQAPVQRARDSLVTIADFLAGAGNSPDVSATYLSDTLVVAALHHPGHANRTRWLARAETIWRAIFDRQPTWSALKPQSFMGTGGLLWPYHERGGR